MKKWMIVFAFILGMCIPMMIGWKQINWHDIGSWDSISIYVDEDTGVEYILYQGHYRGGICPRYKADGTLMIERKE